MGACATVNTIGDLRTIVDKSYTLGRFLYDLTSKRLGQAKDPVAAAYFQAYMNRLAGFWIPSWKFLYQTTRQAAQTRPVVEAFSYNQYTQGSWDEAPQGWNESRYGKWAPLTDRNLLCSAMTAQRILAAETVLPPFWRLTADESLTINGLATQYDLAAKEPPPRVVAPNTGIPLARSKTGLIVGGVVGVAALAALLFIAFR
jgi:hypothetical protein